MTCLDLTLPTPAENLACDEALLDDSESGGGDDAGWLRFWEPRSCFVVVGYAGRVATEVQLDACRENRVPVFRRCSGGGTVLQASGCLNYTLVLNIQAEGSLHNISSANRFILERNRAALQSLLGPQAAISVQGHTDLALGNLKFSGNAQRRKKRFLLFHGTFLLGLEIALIETFLPLPARAPAYRQGRAHKDFLINLDLPAAAVKDALRDAWSASVSTQDYPRELAEKLVRDKYATAEWNFKF